jgi:hypothetical protein
MKTQDVKPLLSILKIISNVNSDNEIDNFSVMASALMHHKDIEITDAAISCFEKWGRKEHAATMRNFTVPTEKWLADYFNETVKYLESL